MDRYLISGGHVVDPASGLDEKLDVLIEGGKITDIAHGISCEGAEVYDASGLYVTPGLVDMHCHLREPGYEYKETIFSGSRAAAAGGYTSIACMANTDPVNDDPSVTSFIIEKAYGDSPIRVYPVGAVTKGLQGEMLTEMGLMAEAGCVAFSDDGQPVANSGMMYKALRYAKGFGALVMDHCEDKSLSAGGGMNEGVLSTKLGLPGVSRAGEEIIVSRDLLLAESLGARVHLSHVSTRGAIELIRRAKGRGVSVSCETCPHYIAGTEQLVEGYNTNAKVYPPLRTEDDRQAVIEGLADGTIDAIATDHAPHHIDEKNVEFMLAANGISAFDTAFSLCYTALVNEGFLSFMQLIKLMALTPAELLNIEGGRLEKGGAADIALFDLGAQYTIDPARFISAGKNTPFTGRRVSGRAVGLFCGGRLVMQDGTLL